VLVGVAALEPWVPGTGVLAVLLQAALVVIVLVEARLFLRPRTGRLEGAVEVRRELPRTLDLGEPAEVALHVRNRLGLPVVVRLVENLPESLTTESPFEELFPAVVRVPPLGLVTLRYAVVPGERGRVEIPSPWMRCGIAGGLARRRSRPDVVSAARVVPALSHVVRYDTLRRSRNLSAIGIHAGRGFLRGREFDRLRDYHVDDDYRDVDWKATARRDRPITRVYRPERSQDVIVAVDASRVMTARSGGLSKLDEAVNAALVLAHVVTSGGDRFGLAVFDASLRTWMAPRSGSGTVSAALDALYDIAPSPFDASFAAACTAIAARQTRRALVVFLTDLPDQVAGEDLVRCLPLLRHRHLVACFTTADHAVEELAETRPTGRRELSRTLAAAELLEEKRRARRRVTEAGAQCMELPPGELAASAVNRYLDAKARGLL
jgi:uncharacterized protein (DUF58 family)